MRGFGPIEAHANAFAQLADIPHLRWTPSRGAATPPLWLPGQYCISRAGNIRMLAIDRGGSLGPGNPAVDPDGSAGTGTAHWILPPEPTGGADPATVARVNALVGPLTTHIDPSSALGPLALHGEGAGLYVVLTDADSGDVGLTLPDASGLANGTLSAPLGVSPLSDQRTVAVSSASSVLGQASGGSGQPVRLNHPFPALYHFVARGGEWHLLAWPAGAGGSSGSTETDTLATVLLRGNSAAQDIELTDPVVGFVLRTPDGQRRRISCGNDGTLTTTAI